MSEQLDTIIKTSAEEWNQGANLIQRLLEVAQPSAVFGEPVKDGEYTVITASEVSAGMGFGYGTGGGSAVEPAEEEGEAPAEGGGAPTGMGTGGGGGGGSAARPVAVISLGPDGVDIKPVVDVTKLGLAMLTAVAAMWVTWGRIQRASRKM